MLPQNLRHHNFYRKGQKNVLVFLPYHKTKNKDIK